MAFPALSKDDASLITSIISFAATKYAANLVYEGLTTVFTVPARFSLVLLRFEMDPAKI
jgi:hypothetical protein